MKKKNYTGGIVVCGKAQPLLQNFWFGLLAFGLFLALPALTLAAPGDLDPTFGNGGKVTTEFSFAHATDIVVQADGKIVVVGTDESASAEFVLVRYHTDGSLDTSFGKAAKFLLRLDSPSRAL